MSLETLHRVTHAASEELVPPKISHLSYLESLLILEKKKNMIPDQKYIQMCLSN